MWNQRTLQHLYQMLEFLKANVKIKSNSMAINRQKTNIKLFIKLYANIFKKLNIPCKEENNEVWICPQEDKTLFLINRNLIC